MTDDTPTDERGTDVEVTAFSMNRRPSGDGCVTAKAKGDIVSVAIAGYDGGTLPGGTQAHAILTPEQAEEFVAQLKDATADAEADGEA